MVFLGVAIRRCCRYYYWASKLAVFSRCDEKIGGLLKFILPGYENITKEKKIKIRQNHTETENTITLKTHTQGKHIKHRHKSTSKKEEHHTQGNQALNCKFNFLFKIQFFVCL